MLSFPTQISNPDQCSSYYKVKCFFKWSSEARRYLSGGLPFPLPSKECHFYPPWGDDSAGVGLPLYVSRHRPFAGEHHIPWLGTKSKQLDTAKCEKEADTWNVTNTICYLFHAVCLESPMRTFQFPDIWCAFKTSRLCRMAVWRQLSPTVTKNMICPTSWVI